MNRNDYMREWRRRQSAEWHEENKEYLRRWHQANRTSQNIIRSLRYRANPQHHAQVVKAGIRRRLQNPTLERAKMKHRRKAAKARRRMQIRGQLSPPLTLRQWECLIEAYEGCCAYCGKRKKLTQDTMDNIVPACMRCNMLKGNRDWADFICKNLTLASCY